MRFYEGRATNPQARAQTNIWLPEKPLPGLSPIGQTSQVTEVEVGSQIRAVSSDTLRMAVVFTREKRQRSKLGHDCAVFALACESGQLLNGQQFNRPGGLIVKVGAYKLSDGALRESAVPSGGIVFTANDTLDEPDFMRSDPHFLVRATVDAEEPLYFSKLGAFSENGISTPVVLSSLASMLELYPAKTIGVAANLYTASYLDKQA